MLGDLGDLLRSVLGPLSPHWRTGTNMTCLAARFRTSSFGMTRQIFRCPLESGATARSASPRGSAWALAA